MEIKLNLLSEAKKTEVRRKKRYRLIVWQEIVGIFLVLFYGGMLFSIYLMYSLQLKNLESTNASKSQEYVFQEITSTEKKFQDINTKVSNIMKFQQEHTVWSNVFIALDKTIPDGVLLDSIVTSDQKVSLSGRADTRDHLLKFQERLNADDCFQNTQVPLSDLFTQGNTTFQLDIDITKECLKPGNL